MVNTPTKRAFCDKPNSRFKDFLTGTTYDFTPPLPPAATVFGINVSGNDGSEKGISQRLSWLGGVPIARMFWDSAFTGVWNGLGEVACCPSKRLHVSFKPTLSGKTMAQFAAGQMDTLVNNYIGAIPSDWDVYLTLHHEPNAELQAGDFTIADFNAANYHMQDLLWAAASRNYVKPAYLYSAPKTKGGPVWNNNWMVPYATAFAHNPKVLWAWDAYGGTAGSANGTYPNVALSLDPPYLQLQSNGWLTNPGTWAITEFNCSRRDADLDGTNQAAWFQQYVNYATGKPVPPRHITIFDGAGVPDFDTVKARKKWADIQGTGGSGV